MNRTQDAHVRVTVTRWVSDKPFPGVVEVLLRDASGAVWTFIDKVPIFDRHGVLTSKTSYPVDLSMACTVLRVRQDEGRRVVDISTVAPWSLESVDGTFEFEVLPDQIVAEGVVPAE